MCQANDIFFVLLVDAHRRFTASGKRLHRWSLAHRIAFPWRLRPVQSSPSKQILNRQIPLPRVVAEYQHPATGGHLVQFAIDGGEAGAGGDADEDAIGPGAAAGHGNAVFLAHLYGAAEDGGIEHLGDNAGADALEAVLSLSPAADGRGFFRLDGVYLKARELGLEHFGTAGDVATGTHAGDQVVEAVGEVGENLGGGGVAVNLDVGGVAELHGHPAVGVFGDQGAGLFDA